MYLNFSSENWHFYRQKKFQSIACIYIYIYIAAEEIRCIFDDI